MLTWPLDPASSWATFSRTTPHINVSNQTSRYEAKSLVSTIWATVAMDVIRKGGYGQGIAMVIGPGFGCIYRSKSWRDLQYKHTHTYALVIFSLFGIAVIILPVLGVRV
jgi:hypothetical protein